MARRSVTIIPALLLAAVLVLPMTAVLIRAEGFGALGFYSLRRCVGKSAVQDPGYAKRLKDNVHIGGPGALAFIIGLMRLAPIAIREIAFPFERRHFRRHRSEREGLHFERFNLADGRSSAIQTDLTFADFCVRTVHRSRARSCFYASHHQCGQSVREFGTVAELKGL